MEADTIGEVQARLRSLGLSSIRVRRAHFGPLLRRLKHLKWWISAKDRMIVSVQLRVMLEAGLPLLQSLNILEGQHASGVARRLRAVSATIQAGTDPKEALVSARDLFTSADASQLG